MIVMIALSYAHYPSLCISADSERLCIVFRSDRLCHLEPLMRSSRLQAVDTLARICFSVHMHSPVTPAARAWNTARRP